MRSSLLGALTLAITTAACGGNVVFVNDDGAGGAGGAGSTSSANTSGTTSSTGTGGFAGSIVPTIEAVNLGANCMPVIGPDPLGGSVAVRYDSFASGPESITLIQAQVLFTTQVEGWVFPIELDPKTSGDVPPGGTVYVDHGKVATAGDASSICQLCGMPGTVTLSYVDAVGSTVSASADFTLGCAF